jgi:hypothetical protein
MGRGFSKKISVSANFRLSPGRQGGAVMTAPYESELVARFGYDLDLAGDVEDNAWIRQVLLRRTQRRYSDKPGRSQSYD